MIVIILLLRLISSVFPAPFPSQSGGYQHAPRSPSNQGAANTTRIIIKLFTCSIASCYFPTRLLMRHYNCLALCSIFVHCVPLFFTVLNSAACCYSVEYYAALCRIVTQCNMWSCIVVLSFTSWYNALHCYALCCVVLRCAALNCTVLHCHVLHCADLVCTVLYCNVLH